MSNSNTTPATTSSLRAKTRNLLNDEKTPSHSGDGGSQSAMTLKSGEVVRFGEVILPASKSESNRALMIVAYGGFAPDFQNLSDSKDTLVLKNALLSIDALAPCVARHDMDSNKVFRHVIPSREASVSMPKKSPQIIDIADCGTAARFMTTYLSCHQGNWILTGTERMCQRPMAPLVDALRCLNADIQYVEKEGCLPLKIKGESIVGGKVSIDMTPSSQFPSSLLLAAPMFPKGLELELIGNLSSLPYLDMTLAMMRHFDASAERHDKMIVVNPQSYQPQSFTVEPDWTAASYWYEMAAFSEECEIRLRGLGGCSCMQGDSIIAEWMTQLGVGTIVEGEDVVLRKIAYEKHPLHFDFSHHPDLYPTMATTCVGLQIDAHFTGLDNLSLKESNRVETMQKELAKLGQRPLRFSAHNDHRIVMALAPLSMLVGPLAFDRPEVVEKSYPGFWEDASFLPIRW